MEEEIATLKKKVDEVHLALLGDLSNEGWLSRLRKVENTVVIHRRIIFGMFLQVGAFALWAVNELWRGIT